MIVNMTKFSKTKIYMKMIKKKGRKEGRKTDSDRMKTKKDRFFGVKLQRKDDSLLKRRRKKVRID